MELKDMYYSDDINSALYYCIFDTIVDVSSEQNNINIDNVTFTSPDIIPFKVEFEKIAKEAPQEEKTIL